MRSFLSSARLLILNYGPNLRDLLIFGGIGCVWHGLNMVYPPSAWCVSGLLLLVVGWRYS